MCQNEIVCRINKAKVDNKKSEEHLWAAL
jgi:hypothetical protein